jgi:FlaA1/EpsC-like NDP-sugar epimerase
MLTCGQSPPASGSLASGVFDGCLLASSGPARIRLFSRDEAKQHDVRLAYQNRRVATDDVIYHNYDRVVQFQIGDVRERTSIQAALQGIEVVFNTAAMKQVPTCEYFPFEAVRTNIVGAENVVDGSAANFPPGTSSDLDDKAQPCERDGDDKGAPRAAARAGEP